MSEITVDGRRYIPADESGEIKIIVLERGFVYVGHYAEDGDKATITDARSLILWGTSEHLGELVGGPKEKTKLGAVCTVTARLSQIIHTIEVSQDGWSIG